MKAERERPLVPSCHEGGGAASDLQPQSSQSNAAVMRLDRTERERKVLVSPINNGLVKM